MTTFGSIWHQPTRPFFPTDDLTVALEAEHAGIFSVVIDWARTYHPLRSITFTSDQPGKIARLAANLRIPVTVQLNQLGPKTADEVEHALDMGARILMLPRPTHPAEVESFISLVRGRAQTLIKLETESLAERVADLRGLPWDFLHVDLINLSLDQNHDWVWEPLLDGTVDRICSVLAGRSIGFGMAAPIGERKPVEALALLREMARLHCGLTMLGPSFAVAAVERNLTLELKVLYAAFEAALWRENEAIQFDQQLLYEDLAALKPEPADPNLPTYITPHPLGESTRLSGD